MIKNFGELRNFILYLRNSGKCECLITFLNKSYFFNYENKAPVLLSFIGYQAFCRTQFITGAVFASIPFIPCVLFRYISFTTFYPSLLQYRCLLKKHLFHCALVGCSSCALQKRSMSVKTTTRKELTRRIKIS